MSGACRHLKVAFPRAVPRATRLIVLPSDEIFAAHEIVG